uniref:Potassium channel domain-containing protein n=1 Tax=Ditylenchus dipsaci TaxID=166011 RepID=A0A915D4A2_9BILA
MFAGKVTILNDVKKSFKALVPIIVLLIYTVIGTVIFMAIEGPNEKYEKEQLKQQREKLLEDTAYRLNTIKTMTPLQAYNHTISSLVRYRHVGVGEVRLNETRWSEFWGSLYFSMTVYTTIGYGNMVPMTTTGRVLTIIYGFIASQSL